MAKKEVTTRPRRRLRRLVVLVILGSFLGLLAALFFSKIYNPFGSRLGDPLVLVPQDADFIVGIPDFPSFLGGIRKREFVQALETNPGFQRLLERPEIRRTGLVDALSSAFRQLDTIQGRLPFGLKLLGDVSGKHVVVAGYSPPKEGEPTPFLCIFQPGSWMALAGVNLLLDRGLYDLLLKDRLAERGLTVEHFRDRVRIKSQGNRDIYLTRIADAVLLSTEGKQLGLIHDAVNTQGIPSLPAARFALLNPERAEKDSEVQILARREALDRMLGLSSRLQALWGPALVDLVQAVLPRFGGDDLYLKADLDLGLTLDLRLPAAPAEPGDFSSVLAAKDPGALRDFMARSCRFIPKEAFALLYAGVGSGELAARFFKRKDFLDREGRKLIEEELQHIPSLGNLDGLISALNQVTGDDLGLIFFKEPRASLRDVARPGYVLVARLTDEQRAVEILESVRERVVASAGQGAIKGMEMSQEGAFRLYRLTLQAGVVDDDRVTKPALAVISGHLLFTNFEPFLEEMAPLIESQGKGFGENPALQNMAAHAPLGLRLGGLLSFPELQDYMEQSVSGWAFARTTPTPLAQIKKREELERLAREKGLINLTSAHMKFVQQNFDRWLNSLSRVERPALRREYQGYLSQLKGLFSGLGIFLRGDASETRYTLRLEVAR